MSVAGDIADAVVAAIEALDLDDALTVVRRKTPSLPPKTDPPQAVVSVGEEQYEPLSSTKDFVIYPLQVTLFTRGGKKLTDDETLRTWRASIIQAVNTPTCFTGVTEFNMVSPSGKTVFDPAALDKDLNASAIAFSVECIEPRD